MTETTAESNFQYRAGRYLRQPGGYRAFIPTPLPPDPPIDLDGPLRKLLSDADRALGRLDGSVQTITGTSYAASNQLIARFQELGILTEITGQKRNRRFRYDSYIALFHDPAPYVEWTDPA